MRAKKRPTIVTMKGCSKTGTNDEDRPCGQEWDIFISHSSRLFPDDEELLRALRRALTRRGLRVFLDFTCLESGTPLLTGLEAAIVGSRIGLVVATEHAKGSGWVEFEIECMKQQRAAGRLKIIAVCLEPQCTCPPQLHADAVIFAVSRVDVNGLAQRVYQTQRKLIQ